MPSKKIVYVAGPMRGYEFFNFPAFDATAAWMRQHGFDVLNPADMDREHGFDAMKLPADSDWNSVPEGFSFDAAVTRDLDAVRKCDIVYLLKGWETSKGAKAEKALAEWLGKTVWFQELAEPVINWFTPTLPLRPSATKAPAPSAQELIGRLLDEKRKSVEAPLFPDTDAGRREYPLCTGLLEYFPRACAEVAHHSFVGNEQHNPGETLHWAKEKSIGRGDQIVRHLMDGKTAKDKGEALHHFAGMCWRSLELFERFLQGIEPFGREV